VYRSRSRENRTETVRRVRFWYVSSTTACSA